MGKVYKALLPLALDNTVKNQFGWLPVSVYRPPHNKQWDELIKDDGDAVSTRRSAESKYLPSLRYSKFNPTLAEMIIRYWSVENDLVVDPFAGRGTRAIVASTLGRRYVGYDVALSTFEHLCEVSGRFSNINVKFSDGCKLEGIEYADLVFTCPPYHRLERYEDGDNQLSDIKDYNEFLKQITISACSIFSVLNPGRFCCWVCGDWRDGKAFRLFHVDCIKIFEAAGFTTHDIVIIENISPFAPLQAGKVATKRYTSKIHEYLLVFRKPEI